SPARPRPPAETGAARSAAPDGSRSCRMRHTWSVLLGSRGRNAVEVALERVEASLPPAPVGLEPGVELGERSVLERVDAPLGLSPCHHEPGVAQDTQVLG